MVLIDGTDRRAGRGAGLLVTDFLAVLNGRKGEGREGAGLHSGKTNGKSPFLHVPRSGPLDLLQNSQSGSSVPLTFNIQQIDRLLMSNRKLMKTIM